MTKALKMTVKIVAAVIVLILLAGIYRFNFTNDDLYVQNAQGMWVKMDEAKSGKPAKDSR